MSVMEQLPEAQGDNFLHDNPEDLGRAFEALPDVTVSLPPGEPSYWALPSPEKTADAASYWRSPGCNIGSYYGSFSNATKPIPMRIEGYASADGEPENANLNLLPEPIITHEQFNETLKEQLKATLPHFAIENSLAQREYGQPMLVCRADVVPDEDGGAQVQLCEIDDVASLWATLARINPIAASYIMALEQQMGIPIYSAELFEFADDPSRVNITPPLDETTQVLDGGTRRYFHNDDHWRGNIHTPQSWLLGTNPDRDEVALIIRARPEALGFDGFMDTYGPRSITMAWNRDSRKALIASGLAAGAVNLDVALDFGEKYLREHPEERLALKADGARTERTGILTVKGTKREGESSAAQIRKKFERNGYASGAIAVQRFMQPPTLTQAGIDLQKYPRLHLHLDNEDFRQTDADKLNTIFRTFFVYLPQEERWESVGGIWQAAKGLIVHGRRDALTGPLYADGVLGHPQALRFGGLRQANELVAKFGRTALFT